MLYSNATNIKVRNNNGPANFLDYFKFQNVNIPGKKKHFLFLIRHQEINFELIMKVIFLKTKL
jgi:hypothetical protein